MVTTSKVSSYSTTGHLAASPQADPHLHLHAVAVWACTRRWHIYFHSLLMASCKDKAIVSISHWIANTLVGIHEWKLVKGLTAGHCYHNFTASYLATVSNNNSKIYLLESHEFSEFSIQPFSYSIKNNVGWLKWWVLIQCWFRGQLRDQRKHH